MIHQPLVVHRGQTTDIQIQAKEIQRIKRDSLNAIIFRANRSRYL